MPQKNELHIIEKKHDVSKIEFNGLKAWPFLRSRIFQEIYKKKYNYNANLRVRSKKQLITNFFAGIIKLLFIRKYDYLFFNNADKRTLIDQKYFDIYFDAIADKLGQNKSCFVEWAIDKHYSTKQTYSKNRISDLPFKLISIIFSYFGKLVIKGNEELEFIKNEFGIQLNTKKELNRFYGEYKFYNFLFKLVKPKAVFLICNYTKIAITTAAKQNNIKVYETQHGFIGDNHQFYNYSGEIPKISYPDYLLTFGEHEKNNIPESFIFTDDQLKIVGSYFLDQIYNNFTSEYLEKLKSKFKFIFCVTLQGIYEEELLKWIQVQAKENKNCLFVLREKYKVKDYSVLGSENIILLPEFNIYEVLKYSDFNITIFSTTAIEAGYFNVKTIFFNIDNLSTKYFDVEKMNARLINQNENLVVSDMIESNNTNSYFKRDYFKNISELEF